MPCLMVVGVLAKVWYSFFADFRFKYGFTPQNHELPSRRLFCNLVSGVRHVGLNCGGSGNGEGAGRFGVNVCNVRAPADSGLTERSVKPRGFHDFR